MNYDGSDYYKTRLGGIVSIATYVFMVVNLVGLITDFFNHSRQTETQATEYFDAYFEDEFSLTENHFEIAFFPLEILPESVGRLRLQVISENGDQRTKTDVRVGECS